MSVWTAPETCAASGSADPGDGVVEDEAHPVLVNFPGRNCPFCPDDSFPIWCGQLAFPREVALVTKLIQVINEHLCLLVGLHFSVRSLVC